MGFSEVYKNHVLTPSFNYFSSTKLKDYFFNINIAHLYILYKSGVISIEIASKIYTGIKQSEEETNLKSPLPDEVEDFLFLFEKNLYNIIGEKVGGYLHTARSRNDIDATLFRMYIRDSLAAILERCIKLVDSIFKKVNKTKKELLLLYTHGQPAQVSTLAHYFSSFAEEFLDVMEGIENTIIKINQSPLGSCAITTTGFPIDRQLLSDILGFYKPIINSYQAISTSTWITYPVMWLKQLSLFISRAIEDIQHKSSYEVGIISFPDDLVQKSSIMPQKRNPVILEHIRIRSNSAKGVFSTIEDLYQNVAYQDVNENGDHVLKLFDIAFVEMNEAIDLFEEVIKKIEINNKRVKEIAIESGSTCTELADYLVREGEISFRIAHKIVSEFFKNDYDINLFNDLYEKETGKKIFLGAKKISEILSPENFVAVRKVLGGPSLEGIEPVLKDIDKRKENIQKFLNSFYKRLSDSQTKLMEIEKELGTKISIYNNGER